MTQFVFDPTTLSQDQLKAMRSAGEDINHCYGFMQNSDTNIVAQVIKGEDQVHAFDHYPQGDVYDPDTHAQYYYHAHREEDEEHGHFHTFLRVKGFPEEITEASQAGMRAHALGEDALSHIIAISMDHQGLPISLFTTNRWVTGETYYNADDMIKMLDHFNIELAHPCPEVNRWISAMLVLFRPQIIALLIARDEKLSAWQASHVGVDVYEDRDLEITSILDIDVHDQIKKVDAALSL